METEIVVAAAVTEEAALEVTDVVEDLAAAAVVETVVLAVAVVAVVTAAVQCVVVAEAVIASVHTRYTVTASRWFFVLLQKYYITSRMTALELRKSVAPKPYFCSTEPAR